MKRKFIIQNHLIASGARKEEEAIVLLQKLKVVARNVSLHHIEREKKNIEGHLAALRAMKEKTAHEKYCEGMMDLQAMQLLHPETRRKTKEAQHSGLKTVSKCFY